MSDTESIIEEVIDEPITLRSVINNVGFEINGKNLLDLPKRVQTDLPF